MPQLIQQYVSRQAIQSPNRRAVVCKNESISYGELDQLTNQLAHRLNASGCRCGDRVAVLIPQSANAIFAMLGILKADCLYVPIDPDGSAEQIAAILNAVKPKVLLAARSRTELLDDVFAEYDLPNDMLVGTLEAVPLKGDNFESSFTGLNVLGASKLQRPYECKPTDLAVIRFHSDDRRGVVLSHANMIYGIDWGLKYFQWDVQDRIASDGPPHFDLATFNTIGTFAAGAELHLVSSTLHSQPHKLAEFLRSREMTQWMTTTSSLSSFVEKDVVQNGDLPSLKRIIWTSEESLHNSAIEQLKQRLPLTQITRIFGVPEASSLCSYFTIPVRSMDESANIPIGRACDGVGLFVLDHELQPVALDEIGELYIGGVGLSSAYWHDPDRTATKFVQHPILKQRLFKTGQSARIGSDGLAYLEGRAAIHEEFEERTLIDHSKDSMKGTIMLDRAVVQSQIAHLIADKLELDEPAVDTDLFNEGILDSLSYVRLVVELQQEFGVQISLGEIDIDHFRTVEQIAEFLMQNLGELATA